MFRQYPFQVYQAVLLGSLSFFPAVIRADEEEPAGAGALAHPPQYVAPASDEGQNAIGQFRVAPGFKASLFAAEPQLANPVCLSIDEQNRFFVVETFRRRNEVLDIRKLHDWLEDDLACRTVADRIAMVKKRMPKDWQKLVGPSERVQIIEDRDGDGRADHSEIFAEAFNTLEDGTAAGVLAWGGNVWFADIPNLWLLRDTTGGGRADYRKSLAYGFGVRYNYSGHDFHGLRMGPDGKIYFSIADRGVHIEKDGHVLIDNPDSGCVMRSNPDGSDLELVHTGLRNPQELAFDEYGNLFTCDNNSDAGDASRWVYVVEGGDSGWRVGWQWHEFPSTRGAWNSEKLWEVNPQIPAFYRLPPIETPKISGPSGLTYSPGTGMPEAFAHRFFLVDFRGGAAGGSGVYVLQNKPNGASFTLAEQKELVTGILPSDVEFGWDGGVYITDWVTGWEPTGKGRIYHVFDPKAAADPLVAETRKIVGEGMGKRSIEELAKLLGHADMRVRMRAQFEMAGRGESAVAALTSIAKANDAQLARIHAIWGLGQIGKKLPGALAGLVSLLADADGEIKAQAAKVLGDGFTSGEGTDALTAILGKLLKDKSLRVRYFAAMALGKIGNKQIAPAIVEMLRENADADAYLRHAGVMALLHLNDPATLDAAAKDSSASVRMAALLVHRKQEGPGVAQFLNDADPNVVLEAARAINDIPIAAALPQLAALVTKPGLTEPIMMRVLNANYRIGTAQSAAALAAYAGRSDCAPILRGESLKMLSDWAAPRPRDRITGLFRPLPKRDAEMARVALEPILRSILAAAPDVVRIDALKAANAVGLNTAPLFDLLRDEKNPPGLRAAALGAMAERKDPKLADAAKMGLTASDETVRCAAIRVQPMLGNLKPLVSILEKGTPREQQTVLQAIGGVSNKEKDLAKEGDKLLLGAFDRLDKGTLPPEAELDLLEASAKRKTGKITDRLKALEAKRAKPAEKDPLALYRETLAGGDADRGAYIFRDRADVSCLRCHAVKTVGGNAGPDLAGLKTRGNREYILESILKPNAKIAPGFESIQVRTADGDVIAGVLKGENDMEVRLDVPNQGIVKILKDQIKKRQGGLSAMPEDISKTLSKEDLRDLVEYLSGL